MAEKGWTAQVAAAAGVAAGTGAAQLGLGYGLGVVEWPTVPAADSVWLGSLGWATWIAASSTVFGAVIADRLGRAVGGAWRFALALSAAVGALLTVALIALPARAAVRTETFAPQTIAAGYALIGVLLGLVIAYWAVVSRPVASNLIATAVWLWSLAVAAVVTTIFWQRPSATYLSSWQFVSPDSADDQYGIIFWPSALLTLLAAFVVGIIGALPAIRRGDLGVGAATSGAVGPLLVAAAFFVLAPQLTGTPGPLQSAYLIAPYAVLAGLAGSAVMVALGQRQARRRTDAAVVPGEQAELDSSPRRAGAVSAASRGAPKGPGDSATGATDDKAEGSGSATAVVPAPRQARAAKPTARARAEAGSPGAAEPPGPAAVAAEPRPRKSFMDRFRRKNAGQDSEPAAVASGRAKAPSPAGATRPPASDAAAGAVAARGKSPAARSGSGAASARSGAPSIDGAARPAASSAPGRSDSRSTVAPPPTSPPIAKINDPRSGEKPPAPRKAPARPSGNQPPGPANAVGSDKSPPARKTPTKSTKATPPAAGAPRQATPGRPAGGKAAPSSPASGPRRAEDADTAELPGVPRPGEDEAR